MYLKAHLGRSTLGLLAAGLLFAGSSLALAQSAFTGLDRAPHASLSFAPTERGQPILAGSPVVVAGKGFKPGQKVALFYGSTPLPGGSLTADPEGKVQGQILVPANAVYGTHPIVVVAEGPYTALVEDLKVSPTVPLAGQANFTVTEATVARALYQSAYSAKTNHLFVTSAVGRPPVQQSELLKLDPATLKVIARVTPAAAPAREGGPRPGPAGQNAPQGPGVYAVYGVGVDDARGTVWVTNTRQNSVAVYRQSDLSLVKQMAPGSVAHARDVAIDSSAGKAYVSAAGTPDVQVFDTGTLEAEAPITIQTRAPGRQQQFSALSLSLDAAAGRLYVVSMSTNEVAVINTRTRDVEHVFAVPGARSAIGVSHDPETGRIFVAAQGSDNLTVLDGKTGAVIADTPVGAGALNVAFDPVKRLAYVSTRGAGTIAVADADGKLVANLGPAPMANHVAIGQNGTVFAVDKSATARGADSDTILRIRPRR